MFMNNYMLTPKIPIPNSIACLSTFLNFFPHSLRNFLILSIVVYFIIIFIFINKDKTAFMYRFDLGDRRFKVFNIASI